MAPDKVEVAYLTYDGLTDPLGQSQIMPYVAGLSNHGYSFTIISFEKPQRYTAARVDTGKWCESRNITWLPQKYHKSPPVLSTIYDLVVLWRTLKQLHKGKNLRIVHCRSYLTSLIGIRAKRKWGIKFIFDMRGFWADERIEGGIWNRHNPLFSLIYRYFKSRERIFLQQADHIVSLTENASSEIRSWNLGALRITVIPTCVDTDLFYPGAINNEDKKNLLRQLNLTTQDVIFLYLGSWGTWYMPDEMLNLFTQFKNVEPRAKFLIVTPTPIKIGQDYPFRQDVIVTSAPHSKVPLYISLARASVCFVKPSFSKKASSATKIGELMAMETPIITNSGWGDVDELLVESCVVLNEFSPDEMRAGVVRLLSGKLNGAVGLEKLTLKYGNERYLDVYKSLT